MSDNAHIGELNPPNRLMLTPGPSSMDPRVYRALATPLVGHVDPWFRGCMDDVQVMLRQIFQTENQVQVVANGQRVSANHYLVDGVQVDSLGNGGAAVITPNQESVSEITAVAGSFDAEDGRNSGLITKTVSKSGTNRLHGSGAILFQDPGLNAFNKFYGPTPAAGAKPLTCSSGTTSTPRRCVRRRGSTRSSGSSRADCRTSR